MFSAKQLTDEQKQALHEWAAAGDSIADLQRKLQEQYGLRITYMDARFMVLDLGIQIQEKNEEPEEEKLEEDAQEVLKDDSASENQEAVLGQLQVSMDHIAIPGAIVSGSVVFSNGEKGKWLIDQAGRPALEPDTAGYRPSEEDMVSFQQELMKLLRDEQGI